MIWFLVWNIQRPFIVKLETLIYLFAWFSAISMHHKDHGYHHDDRLIIVIMKIDIIIIMIDDDHHHYLGYDDDDDV